jgi:PAS domain S-box-containing protein
MTSSEGSTENYRELFENAGDAIVVFDLSGKFQLVNKAGEELSGYSRDELMRMSILDVVSKPAAELIHESLKKPTAESAFLLSVEILNKQGRRIPVEISCRWIYELGVPVAVHAIARDITERKQDEEALQQSEQQFREIFEGSIAGLSITTPDGRILACNPAFARIFGFESVDACKRVNAAALYKHPADRVRCLELLRRFRRLENHETEMQRADGIPVYITESTSGIFDSGGTLVELRSHIIDITERKRTEEALHASQTQLQQSQKLEAVGQLAGGVAHDFNNLLTAILGYSELSLLRLQPDDPVARSLEQIGKASRRGALLTRQLLAFSRKQILQRKVFDLNHVVTDMHDMLSRLIGANISLVTHLDQDLGRVKADPGQIQQIIMNLVVNARDAMPNGGDLSIETANVRLDDAFAQQHPPTLPGEYILMAIRDTGAGMDSQTRAHIFEPFFTTKKPGEGSGLGLSTVYGIVKQSGGYIWVESEPGRGTVFRLYLPRVKMAMTPLHPSLPISPSIIGWETVLLFENDARVRSVVRDILESGGYSTITCDDMEEAVRACETQSAEIHLLLTDVVVPKMSGKDFAERIGALRPKMKVLFMSGFTNDVFINDNLGESNVNFILKPFSPDELLKKIRQVLDSAKAGN